MAFQSPFQQTLWLTRISIVLAVMVTALTSAIAVQMQLERHEIYPEQIPLADLDVWHELGR